MATNQKQEVELLIKAGTEGLKSIGQLVEELKGLGQDTGEASEKLEGLAGALSELRDQQKLVRQFANLKSQTKDLADQQARAKDRATELGKALAQTEKPTRAQRNEFEKAKKAARDADQAWQENQRQLNGLRESLSGAGISTRDLASEQQRIKREIAGVDDEIGSVTTELTQMRDSAKAAASGSRELGDDVQKSSSRVGKFRERLQGLNPILGKVGSGLKTTGIAVAGFVAAAGASVATLSIFSKGQAKLADELTNTSNAIGVNREQLQLWRIAGERVGLSGEKVSDILRNVTERLGEFSRTGGGEAAQVMDTLNLKIEEFRNLSPDEQLLKLGSAIGELGSKSEQVALLEKLASDASQLQPLLENNAAGLQAIFEEAQKDGAIYSDAELDKLNKANDVYNSIDLKLQALTTRIGAKLAPAVGQATDKVLELFNSSGAGDKLVELFGRATTAATDFFKSLLDNQESIGEGFQALVDTVQFLGNGISAVFRSVQAVAAGASTIVSSALTTMLNLAATVAKGLNALGVVGDEAYGTLQAKADAAVQTTQALADQTVDYGKKAWQAGKDAFNAFDNTEKAAKKAGEGIKETVGTLEPMPEALKKVGDEADSAAQKTEDLASAYEDLGVTTQKELDEAADKAGEAFRTIQSSGKATQREISDAFQAYAQAIIDTGDKAEIKALESEAATLGLGDALKDLGVIGEESGNKIRDSFNEALNSASDEDALKSLQISLLTAASAGEDVSDELREVRQRLLEIQQLQEGVVMSRSLFVT
ncbi:hypothetical protein ACFQGA_09580 [Marinobacter koreensis]|uniref:hypothetical protein n=1 Tax=Marinobacter koreensis TaxID=335974 RepID=UPI0036100BCD